MVIQRLQNLYLLIAAVLMGLFCYFPFVEFTTVDADYQLSIHSLKSLGIADTINNVLNQNIDQTIYFWGMFTIGILIVLLILVALFLFKNLKMQKRITWVSLIITICFYASSGIFSWFVFASMREVTWSFCSAVIYPPLAVIFLGLALRSIMNDSKLLNASYRIR